MGIVNKLLKISMEEVEINKVHTAEELCDLYVRRSQAVRPIVIGAYLGYPVESTAAYFERAVLLDTSGHDQAPSSEGTVFEDTGFVMTKDQREIPPALLIAKINGQRFCPIPFSAKKDAPKAEVDDTAILALLQSNRVFVQRCNENIAVMYRYHRRSLEQYIAFKNA